MTDYKRGVRFDCQDCGHDTRLMGEIYMVHDGLWNVICKLGPADMLCIRCLEKRICRKLNWADFTDAPINWDFDLRRSLLMRSRVNGW